VSRDAHPRSRRDLFAPHLADPRKLRRCLVCQWAIDQDHDEALQTRAEGEPAPASQDEATEELVVVDFALV
jgi:hypothetical protein